VPIKGNKLQINWEDQPVGGVLGGGGLSQILKNTSIERTRDNARLAQVRSTHYSKRWVWPVTEQSFRYCGDEIARMFPSVPATEWPERFSVGGVYVNRERAIPGTVLPKGGELEYFEPLFPLKDLHRVFPKPIPAHILFSDEDVSVVYKSPGVPSTSIRDFPEENLQSYLSNFFGGPVHLPSRLDVAVGGVLIVSHSSRMNRYLQKAQLKRWIKKSYVAEVEGVFPHKEIEVHLPIGRHPSLPMLRWIREDGGEQAHSNIVRKGVETSTEAPRSMVVVQPVTGRTHQIRVHCAALGFPIVGDPFYGNAGEKVHLVSHSVEFFHPFSRRLLAVSLPLGLTPSWVTQYSSSYESRCESNNC